ncbi:hypothetical protein OCGS_0457 [Oceaniovalibus guishaninsula JLT2003]|uniref:Uncharacterized protein n=1 Tax=Oceaniovalibus guishaninsula JLT2003 TaxID=1231392 RepID=K2HFW0_9RHOB|nr:hypothetical protein OCGS_0457 [Oceaniovalibus guishaninsula JLT2003]
MACRRSRYGAGNADRCGRPRKVIRRDPHGAAARLTERFRGSMRILA